MWHTWVTRKCVYNLGRKSWRKELAWGDLGFGWTYNFIKYLKTENYWLYFTAIFSSVHINASWTSISHNIHLGRLSDYRLLFHGLSPCFLCIWEDLHTYISPYVSICLWLMDCCVSFSLTQWVLALILQHATSVVWKPPKVHNFITSHWIFSITFTLLFQNGNRCDSTVMVVTSFRCYCRIFWC
jgi:hypothetical protein